MPRPILDEGYVYPAIRDKLAGRCSDILGEVKAAIAANDIVVGMKQNPQPTCGGASCEAGTTSSGCTGRWPTPGR